MGELQSRFRDDSEVRNLDPCRESSSCVPTRDKSLYLMECSVSFLKTNRKNPSGALFSLHQQQNKDDEGNIILWLRNFVGGERFQTTKEQNQMMGYRKMIDAGVGWCIEMS
jgi:hypothetical protein